MFENLKFSRKLGAIYYLDWVQDELVSMVVLVVVVEHDFGLESMVEALG